MQVQHEKNCLSFKRQLKDNNHKVDIWEELWVNNTASWWKVFWGNKFRNNNHKEPLKDSTQQKDITPIFHPTIEALLQ